MGYGDFTLRCASKDCALLNLLQSIAESDGRKVGAIRECWFLNLFDGIGFDNIFAVSSIIEMHTCCSPPVPRWQSQAECPILNHPDRRMNSDMHHIPWNILTRHPSIINKNLQRLLHHSKHYEDISIHPYNKRKRPAAPPSFQKLSFLQELNNSCTSTRFDSVVNHFHWTFCSFHILSFPLIPCL